MRAAAFVALSLVVVFLVGEVLDRVSWVNPNTPKIREVLALEGETNDVLYLGDSTTLDGVNPVEIESATGARGYNLASGGQSLLDAEMLLRHYLEHNAKPRMVMLGLFVNRSDPARELNPEIFFGLPSTMRGLMWEKADEQAMTNATLSFRVFNWFKAYRYRTNITHLLDYLQKTLISKESRAKRFVRGHLALDYTKKEKRVASTERSIAQLNEVGLDSFLAFCSEQQIPVLLFEPPNTPGFSEITQGRSMILAGIEQRVRARRNLRFRSFNDLNSLTYASDEWSGRNHLNSKGAIRFSREQIAPFLQEALSAR